MTVDGSITRHEPPVSVTTCLAAHQDRGAANLHFRLSARPEIQS